MGRALKDDLDLLRVLKQMKHFWLPKSPLAILLEQFSMRSSKKMGHVLQDDLDLFARIKTADVFLEFTQESVGHPSEAALHAVLKEMGRALQDDLDFVRVLKQLMCFWNLPKSYLAILLEQLSMRSSRRWTVLSRTI